MTNIKVYYKLHIIPSGYSNFYKIVIKKCSKVITITIYEYDSTKQIFEKIDSKNLALEDMNKMWNLNNNSTFEDFCEQYRYFKSIVKHNSDEWLYEKADFINHWENQPYYINIVKNDN